MPEKQIPIKQPPERDPTKCYVCEEKATGTCSRCALPICEEHRVVKYEPVMRARILLCDECADYYEELIQPD